MTMYRQSRGGYTMIELMVVVTVSTMIFASAIFAFTQQNQRTRFSESVQTFGQNLQDVLNDVEIGYYPSNNNIVCNLNPSTGSPVITIVPDGSKGQATSELCTFMGKVIDLNPGANSNAFNIYTVAGRQFLEGDPSKPVSNIDDAKTTLITNAEVTDVRYLRSGLVVSQVSSADGANSGSGVAIVVNSGSGGISKSGYNTRAQLALAHGNTSITSANIAQATSGIRICLQEEGGGRTAVVRLGSGESKVSVDVRVDEAC